MRQSHKEHEKQELSGSEGVLESPPKFEMSDAGSERVKEQMDEGVGVFEPDEDRKDSHGTGDKVDQFNLNFEDPMKMGNKDWLSDLDYDQIDSLREDELGTPPQRPRAALDSLPSEPAEPVSLLKIDPDTLFSSSFEKEC